MNSDPAIRQRYAAIRLVIADVDGTLVTPDKVLTPRACAAVCSVLDAGIGLHHYQRTAASWHENAD